MSLVDLPLALLYVIMYNRFGPTLGVYPHSESVCTSDEGEPLEGIFTTFFLLAFW